MIVWNRSQKTAAAEQRTKTERIQQQTTTKKNPNPERKHHATKFLSWEDYIFYGTTFFLGIRAHIFTHHGCSARSVIFLPICSTFSTAQRPQPNAQYVVTTFAYLPSTPLHARGFISRAPLEDQNCRFLSPFSF